MKAVLFGALALCAACARTLEQPKAPAAPRPRGLMISDASRPRLPLEQLRPAEIPAAVEATYRLMPDRRVLAAVADICELRSGRKESEIAIDFREGAWHIRYAGLEVGALPELATFEQDLHLLTEWSARLQPRRPAAPLPDDVLATIDQDIAAFKPPNLFAAIDLIARHTRGSLDATAAARAEHASTLLASQIFDRFDLGHPLRARTLALLAIAKDDDSRCCTEDVAINARLLGYQKEAESLASNLPRSSFAAGFVFGSQSGASGPAFEWLQNSGALHLATLSDPQNMFHGSIDVQSAPLLMEVSDFGDQLPIARAEESLILREVESKHFNSGALVFNSDDWTRSYANLNLEEKNPMQRFDRALLARIKTLENGILGADAVRSYYESNFYAALFTEFNFHYYLRGDRDGTRAFISALGKPSMDLSTQVVAWMNSMVDAWYEAARGTPRPTDALQSIPLVGRERQSHLLQNFSLAIGNRIAVRAAANELYKQFDCRPSEVYAASRVSMNIIGDPRRRDRYLSSVIDRAPSVLSEGDTAYYRYLTADRAALRDLVEHGSSSTERVTALRYLSQLGEEDSSFVHRKFEEIVQDSTEMSALSAYATYLNDHNEAATKERFMRRWMAKWGDRADSILVAWVASSLADALERQGKYEEAWQVIEPHIRVYSANALNGAASVLQHLGRIDEANKLDAAAVDRYNSVGVRGEFAVILWREGKFEEAAALFDPNKVKNPAVPTSWELPDQFVETFKDAKTETAVAAFSALIAAKLDFQLLDSFPQKALDKHRPELAFALAERLASDPSRIPAQHRPESISALLAGYRALKELKGADAALAWLQQRLPSSVAMQAIVVFYEAAEYDLVQRYAAAVSEQLKSSEVAAIEAASLSAMRVPQTDPRWQKLDERIRSLPAKSENPMPMAQYLAGFVDETTFFAAAKKRLNYPDAEYFAGVKDLANDDYERSLAMMIGASFGPPDYPPPAWASSQLYRWESHDASWDLIKAKHLDAPARPFH